MKEERRKLSKQEAMKKVELAKVVFLLSSTHRYTGVKSTE